MRKFLAVLLLLIPLCFCISANAEFNLPASLTSIGDEAFAGTTITTVTMPEGLTFIGKNAFAGTENLTVIAPAGSYAETWALEQSFQFIPLQSAAASAEAHSQVRILPLAQVLQALMCLAFLGMALDSVNFRPWVRPELQPFKADFP